METICNSLDVTSITIKEQKYFNKLPFPLVLTPKEEHVRNSAGWNNYITTNKDAFKKELFKHGAVLFRGFPIQNPVDFDNFVKSFQYGSFPYVGGAAPRRVITGNVFTANEAPPDQLIPFHHEMAQVPDFPKVLFFYCDLPPQKGGQTPLVVSNVAYQTILEREPDFVAKLEEHGVCYTRVLPDGDDPSSPIGRGWQSTFQTEDKEEAEKRCQAQGTSFEWLPNGCMKTVTKALPAVREDSRSGKKMWFNSIIAAYLGWRDCRNDPEKAVMFGNGDLMPAKCMATVEAVLEEIAVDFTWQAGDVVMVDNRQALHGRRSYEPPRRIMACLCQEV